MKAKATPKRKAKTRARPPANIKRAKASGARCVQPRKLPRSPVLKPAKPATEATKRRSLPILSDDEVGKAVATMLWEHDPQAAQLTLGHTNSQTTRQHYVELGGIVTRALDRLPQPAAFTEGLGKDGAA